MLTPEVGPGLETEGCGHWEGKPGRVLSCTTGCKLTSQPHSLTRAPAAHASAQAQDRPTATVSPLRTQNSPSRLHTTSLRPHSVVSPQHVHQPPVHLATGTLCPRPAILLTSAASAITPPNISAASLSGEAGGGPVSSLSTSSPTSTGCKPDERKNEKVSGPSWASPLSPCGPDTNDTQHN